MNNLPKNMDRHTVFRGQSYSHTFVFPTGYLIPPVDQIRMEVRDDTLLIEPDFGDIQVDGLRVTFTYDSDTLKEIPQLCDHYLVFGAAYILGGQLYATWDYGDPSGGESQIVLVEGNETVIEVTDLNLIQQQVAVATEKANQTAADAIQTGEDRVQTGEDRIQTGEDRQATEAARDQVIGPLATKIDLFKVATFAAMQQYIIDEDPDECLFLVLVDETYGFMPRFHGYTKLPLAPIVQLVSYTS